MADDKKKDDGDFSMTELVVTGVLSFAAGVATATTGLAMTDSIRTPEEREAAKKMKELQSKSTRQG